MASDQGLYTLVYLNLVTQVSNKTNKPKAMGDPELVALCQTELPYITSSYKLLLDRYEVLVFQYCRNYLHNSEDAEEVAQDVFLRIFHHIKRFEGRSSFKTWLMQITKNQCSRKYQKLKQRAKFEAPGDTSAFNESIIDEPHDDSANINGDNPVQKTMDGLGDGDREILSMRHIMGLTVVETAKLLGISESAAKMRHLRAVARFKEKYKALGAKV
jgi:RNA polymerase sigma-70 factor, ECF subfamily